MSSDAQNEAKKIRQTLSDYPKVLSQWHPEKNGDVDARNLPARSHAKYWWKCEVGSDHVWESSIAHRTLGRNCPACSGRKVVLSNSLFTTHPKLALEWHAPLNNNLTPKEVLAGSNKKVWWQCPVDPDHTYLAIIASRALRPGGCPICAGKQVVDSTSLGTKFPDVAATWHPTKNGDLTPFKISPKSGKKYWWRCESGHEWISTAANRTGGNGCPKCSGRQVSDKNSFASMFPALLQEWDWDLNGDLDPRTLTKATPKKVWWRCKVDTTHKWEASIASRTRLNNGCPLCSGHEVSAKNSLESLNPKVASEWHPTLNGALTPDKVAAGSHRLVWWQCSNSPDHVWQAAIVNRARENGSGCHRCNFGWTLQAIRGFVHSIKEHLTTFTPAELYLLFQQNGILNVEGKGTSFVKALVTGRFPIEEIELFADSKPSLVDEFISNKHASLEEQLFSDELSSLSTDTSFPRSMNAAEIDDSNALPELNVQSVLSSLDSAVITSADEEAIEFLLTSAQSKLWKVAYRDPKKARDTAAAYEGGDYASRVKQLFLDELSEAESLPIPVGYQFSINRKTILPNLMQRHAALKVLKSKRVGNWSGTGSGKTLGAIYASRLIDADLTVIACPNPVVDGWKDTINNAFPSCEVQTKTWEPVWVSPDSKKYLILNYEAFQSDRAQSRISTFSKENAVNFLVVDEIHYAKQRTAENMSKRRTMLTHFSTTITKKNPRFSVLGLSATPVINNLQEGRSLIDLITGLSHDDLDVEKASIPNCMKMHQRLVTLGIRWMPEYPLKFYESEIPIDCRDHIDEIRALGRGGSPLELEKILTRARLPVIVENIVKKTLIYTHLIQDIDLILKDAIVAKGWTVGFYTGEDKTGLKQFIQGDLDVLIGSSAISTGVDGLQTVCNRLIVNVLPWTAAEFEQLKGRIFRQGQTRDHVNLLIPKTFCDVGGQKWSWCESKLKRLKFKKSVADAVVDGVVPEGHLRSPAQAYQDVMSWLDRIDRGDISSIVREKIVIDLPNLTEAESKSFVQKFGDFSRMNQRWNNSNSGSTFDRLQKDTGEWEHYHRLYRDARKTWNLVPFEEFITWASKREGYVIADMGCGEAKVAEALKNRHTIYSFDHVAINEEVIACDISRTPLDPDSVDVALFSLSLMGSNFSDYLAEAHRILKLDGHLHVWEATSRFSDADAFVDGLRKLGFDLIGKNLHSKFTHIHCIKSGRSSVDDVKIRF
jgi:superfamily II DNA or RNA helicase